MNVINKIFQFGEKIEKYEFKVLNERDIRASAGIMFLFGIISLFSFILTKNLFWANLFTITFIIEFVMRVFINPTYAPYMVLGHMIVSNQEPEWVEATPKKFAWVLAVILGGIMTYFILFDILTPARMLTCLLCLVLLYLESVFGICLGCLTYKIFDKKLNKCAGDTCEVTKNKPSLTPKFIALIVSAGIFYSIFIVLKEYKYYGTTTSVLTQSQKDDFEFKKTLREDIKEEKEDKQDEEKLTSNDKDCEPPQFAIDMGHREIWLEHNGCNNK